MQQAIQEQLCKWEDLMSVAAAPHGSCGGADEMLKS